MSPLIYRRYIKKEKWGRSGSPRFLGFPSISYVDQMLLLSLSFPHATDAPSETSSSVTDSSNSLYKCSTILLLLVIQILWSKAILFWKRTGSKYGTSELKEQQNSLFCQFEAVFPVHFHRYPHILEIKVSIVILSLSWTVSENKVHQQAPDSSVTGSPYRFNIVKKMFK